MIYLSTFRQPNLKFSAQEPIPMIGSYPIPGLKPHCLSGLFPQVPPKDPPATQTNRTIDAQQAHRQVCQSHPPSPLQIKFAQGLKGNQVKPCQFQIRSNKHPLRDPAPIKPTKSEVHSEKATRTSSDPSPAKVFSKKSPLKAECGNKADKSCIKHNLQTSILPRHSCLPEESTARYDRLSQTVFQT